MTDTARLEGIIADTGYKKSYLAKVIGVTPSTFSRKLKNKGEFKAREIDVICDLLGITSPEEKEIIFFARE